MLAMLPSPAVRSRPARKGPGGFVEPGRQGTATKIEFCAFGVPLLVVS
jgi:hypothetical protein